jgi:hypothetical protein
MKKLILSAAIILAATVGAFAQKTADANLSVTIKPIQTITVLNPTVNLSYETTEDYSDGVSKKIEDHLKVYSTGAFQVNVTASDLVQTGGTETIKASGITVFAEKGSTNGLETIQATAEPVPLPIGTATSTVFTSPVGGIDRSVSITYKGAGGDEYLNKFFKAKGENSNVYTTKVTYSIEAM